jgi:diguanylate cyclase (GGDEF)-like protein
MTFDLPTLMMAAAFVAAVSGAFLVFAWMQDRNAPGTLWWASANLLLAASVPLSFYAGRAMGSPVAILAVTLLNISPALIWAAARSTNARAVNPFIVIAGAALWLLAMSNASFRQSQNAQIALNLVVIVIYLYAAAFEFWREGDETVGARWPLIVLLVAHGGVFVIGAFKAAMGLLPTAGPTILTNWLGLIHFETMVFVLGTAIFMVAMARERSAMVHKQAARVDYLTGIANRRAFLESANSLISRCRIDDVPLSLAVFDLDRFKAINDSFGHKAGDDMLVVFTETARKMLRPTDMLGRLGGEEFAVVMPATDSNSAYIVAERIRAAFAQASRGDGDRTIAATTSAGVATAWPGGTLDGLMTAADGALYRAKALGRDRVEADESRRPPAKRAEPVMSARVA